MKKKNPNDYFRFPKTGVQLFFTLLAFAAIFLTYAHNLKTQPLHPDEWSFTQKSYYFDLFFIKHNFSDPRWHQYQQNPEANPKQPKLGPYLFGAGLHLSGVKDIDQTLASTQFSQINNDQTSWWNRFFLQPITDLSPQEEQKFELIWIARKISLGFALTALLFTYLFAQRLLGSPFALIAVLILSSNRLVFNFSLKAMTDSIQLAFFSLNLLLSLFYLQSLKLQNRRVEKISLLLGINSGLAVSTKISGILTLIHFISLNFLLFLLKPGKQLAKKISTGLFLSLITAYSLFFLLHPYLYPNPLKNTLSVFRERLRETDYLSQIYPESELSSPFTALRHIVRYTLLPHGYFTNFPNTNLPLDLMLTLTGFILLLRQSYSQLKAKKITAEAVLTLWTAVTAVSLVFYLKNNWPRYYLPLEYSFSLIQIYTLKIIFEKLKKSCRLKIKKPNFS